MAAGALDRLGHHPVELDVLERRVGRVAARELDEVADQAGQLLGLADHVAQEGAPLALLELGAGEEDLHVRAQGGDGRTQLVRRVGHQPALRGL